MNKRVNIILFVLGLLLGIGLALGYWDYKRNINDSLLYLYTSILSMIVMSLLTFLIYKVNERAADTNQRIAQITTLQVYSVEKRHYSKIILETKKYVKAAEILKFMTYPNLPLFKKRRMIVESLKEEGILNRHSLTFLDLPKIEDLPEINSKVNEEFQMETLNGQELKDAFYINDLFNNAIPNSINSVWKLKDAIIALNKLRQFIEDEDFYEFGYTAKYISDTINLFELSFDKLLEGNDKNCSFVELSINQYLANLLYLQMTQVLENLSEIEKYSLEKYKEMIT
ncbi:hypothetical protein [Virgibacillus halodenitrificans]|uniref:hypothetical protein n=1 Tax=Virgibacillus halodenitrificans TaxID=1482 RepID=UPI0002FC2926|nr:hypothetical protein [Virgibacillus halodenitrificans]